MNKGSIAQIVVMGVTGAGKSTIASILAKRMGCELAEADAFHSPANIAKMSSGTPLNDHDRWPWLWDIAGWIHERERHGRSAVIACSALRHAYRDILRASSPHVFFVHLVGPRELIIDRLERRAGHFMPPSLLDSQYATLEPLRMDEHGITVDVSRPLEESVGTVTALMRPHLDPVIRREHRVMEPP